MAVTGKGDTPNLGNIVTQSSVNCLSQVIPGKLLGGRTLWNAEATVRTISRDFFFEATPAPPSGGTQIFRALLGVG